MDCALGAQRWSCWEWSKSNSYKDWVRSNWDGGVKWQGQVSWDGDPFQADPEIPAEWRTEILDDYRRTGYDRVGTSAHRKTVYAYERKWPDILSV